MEELHAVVASVRGYCEELRYRIPRQIGESRFLNLIFCLLLAVLALSPKASFALEPAMQNGLSWLQVQVQPDGSLASESNSVATPFQARTETAFALRDLATVPTRLTDAIQAEVVTNNEYAARQLLVLEGAVDGSELLDQLLARQNPDGGFGGTNPYKSNPLDTAYALMAAKVLAGEGYDISQIVGGGLVYLAGSQSTDGSWVHDSQANVFATAAVLSAVQEWYSAYSVGTMTSKAMGWLLSSRSGGVYPGVMEAAEALIALSGQTNARDVIGPVTDQLRTAQGSDGAWQEDPYVTALALRALWSASQPPLAAAATGEISGKVVDAADGGAIPRAALQLVENSNFTTLSGSDGAFTLSGVTPGTYTLRVSKLGYEARQFVVTVTAGEAVTFSNIALKAQALTASLSGVVKASNGAAIADAVVAVGTVSTATGSTGAYSLTGLSPGTATVTVAHSGYLSAVADVDFSAGNAYTFSPTLYTSSVPTTATLRGKLTDAVSGAAISGGVVTAGGVNITTATDGSFEYTGLASGALSLTASATGYQDYSAEGSLSLGINDIGRLAMQRLPTVSTLSGKVVDAQSGTPLADAQISLQGSAQSTLSAVDGTYSLGKVTGTSLVVNVSASGYQSTSFDLTVTQPGDITADFPLLVLQPSAITFSEIKTDKDYYAPSDKLSVIVSVSNSSTSAADLVIEAQVRDTLNNVSFEMPANATGLGLTPANLPLTITAASSNDIELSHSMIRETGGQHTVLVHAHDASGNVVAEGTTTFVVLDEALLGGGLEVSPPLAQSGLDTPVNFTARLGNFGNLPLESATAQLVVTLNHPDTNLSTQPETSVSQFTDNSLLYKSRALARDSSGNLYTVLNSYNDGRVLRIDSSGNTSVYTTIPNANGALRLVDVRVDAQDNVWVAGTDGRIWEISPALAVTETKIAALGKLTGFDISAAGDILATGTGYGVGQEMLVKRDAAGVETVLWSDGLSTPVGIASDGAGGYLVSNSKDGTLVKVSVDGAITPFVSGLATPKGIVSDGAGNYFVANSGNGSVVKVASDGRVSTVVSGLPQPAGIALSADGNLYVTTWGNSTVYRVSQTGTAEIYARGLANHPEGMKYDGSGNLYIADDYGTLSKKDTNGQVSVLATTIGTSRGVDVTASGDVLVASHNAGSIVKVSGTTKTNFATGLAGPYGLAVSPVGDVWVSEQGQNRIDRFAEDGALLERIESVLVNPNDMAMAPDGRLWVCNSNAISLVQSDVPSIWSAGRTYTKIAYDRTSATLVAISKNNVYRIDAAGSAVLVKTLPTYAHGIAVGPSGDIILGVGATIQKLDSAGGLTELASFPSTVQSLTADGTARLFITAGYKLYRVDTDDSVTPIPVPGRENAQWVKAGVDGQLLVWTNYNRLYRVDADTGDFVRVTGPSYVSSAITDAIGNLNVTVSNRHQLSRYDSSGVLLHRITGFSGPKPIVWYGNEARFIDSLGRMFSVVPRQVPTLIGGNMGASFLAVRGADLFATKGAMVYQWNGTAWIFVKIVPGAALRGITARPDGAITVADYSSSRVLTLDGSTYATLEDYGGVTTPWGVAVAPDGKIYVADYASSTVSRLEGMGEAPTFLAKVPYPRYLTVEPVGTLLVSMTSAVDRLDPATGKITKLPAFSASPQEMLVDGSRILAVDSLGRVLKLENDTWSLLASGINDTRALRLMNDQAFVLNGNGALTVYQSGNLDIVAETGIGQPRFLASTANGWFAGGDSGALAIINHSGVVTPVNIASLILNKPVYGLQELSSENSVLLAGNGNDSTLYHLTIAQPQSPPAAGTVVYTATVPISSLPAGDGLSRIDFGSWVPPYSGDFRAEVTVPGVLGVVTNFLYVGPNAQGLLSTSSEDQAPGDQSVPFNLDVTGADFVSLSRVETGLIRPLTTISRPYGMVGDKSGNLWYTDATHLYRKSTSGVNDTVVSGLSLALGLAVDSQERFYLASRNATTGNYELLRVGIDGTVETVADLGVTRVNGVGVNSRDEVFVGAPNDLLKIDPSTGSVSTFTTVGLPNPRNIVIDGKDNIYVQNELSVISMIKPDQSSILLYSKGDGTIDPKFEGDGYPNIAADCADNFYIAPTYWKVINQLFTEEHVLAQVVPRTGQVSALFDGLQIRSHLRDIDYLAFDRFGSRLLMWAHGYNEIWQVPVTCGAISVEAHLVAQPGQSLSGFSRPPSAVVPLADGRTEYVFSLRDVTAQGASISGVTELTGLLLGENRPVMESAYLQFQNSFAPQQVKLLLDVPNVHVHNLVNIAVATDKAEYSAGDTAQISGSLTNQNAAAVSGDLQVDIEDAAGVSLGSVIQQPAAMGAGESFTFNNGYAIGTIVPGKYDVVARLYENGEGVAVARVGFKVLADQEQATADSRLSLDRQAYAPSDRLIISSRASNRSLNVVLENLRLRIRMLDPSGVVLENQEYPIPQLAPGLSQSFTTSYAYRKVASGTYHVEQTLMDADGRSFDQHVVDYTVQSSADTGYGLTGSMMLSTHEYAVGDSVPVLFGVNNTGNADVSGLPLTLAIVNPDTQEVIAQYPYTADIAAGDLYTNSATWTATGQGGEYYALILQAEAGGNTVNLAQDVIHIKADVVNLELLNRFGNDERLLVLAGCGKYVEVGKTRQHIELEAAQGNLEQHDGHDQYCVHDAEPDCSLERAAAIDTLLTELSVSHYVTNDPAVFRSELRSGLYDGYWVSGKAQHLDETLGAEIREAAFRGDGVLLDGLHDESTKTLDEIGGVQIHGKPGARDQAVSLAEPFQDTYLPTLGRGLKLVPTTGQVVGRFGLAVGDPPAVTTDDYGYGHGMLYGFDLIRSVSGSASGWQDAFGKGLTWAAPAFTGAQVVGEAVQFEMQVSNLGMDTDVGVRLSLPAGGVYLSSDTAPASTPGPGDTELFWSIFLAKDETRTIKVMVRLPETAGMYSFVSETGAIKNGVYQRFGDPVSSFVGLTSALQSLSVTMAGINQLPITLAKGKAFRNQTISLLETAQSSLTDGQYDAAIDNLVAAIDKLKQIITVETKDLRYQLDLAIKEAEWQWGKTR